ncbi:MAG: hypothetical protein ACKOW8_11750 [Flavobacteriales bacterium]
MLKAALVLPLVILNVVLYSQSPSTFSTPGSYTWTCPAGVTTVQVEVWGAGGGGGNGLGGGSAYGGGDKKCLPIC